MALNTRQQAYQEALSIMNSGSSSLSPTANKLISILEGAEGTLSLRQKISAYLQGIFGGSDFVETDFQKKSNIKSKLAYLVSLSFPNSPGIIDINTKNNIISYVNRYIEDINENILKEQDFSESAVIRLSAFNRVSINLSDTEKAKLSGIGTRIADIVKGDTNLTADLNINYENSAQAIYKLKSLVNTLIRKGKIPHDNADVALFQSDFEPKLKDLNDLDNSYHTLNHARNNFYRIQRDYGDIEVLSKSKHDDLCRVLFELTKQDVRTYFNDKFNGKIDSSNLESELMNLKSSTDIFRAALKTVNLKESDFDRYYLAHFSQEMLKKAKLDLDAKKRNIFKDNVRDFESDVAKWRDMQRERIIHFATINDVDSLDNIFSRDRKLFVLKGANRIGSVSLASDDAAIINGLDQVLERRYTSISREQRRLLRDTIINENCATNELYYGDNNRFMDEKDDTVMQNIMQWTESAGRGIQNVEKYTTPVIRGFVNVTKSLIEGASGLTGKILTGTTSKVENVLKSYNTWANTSATSFLGKVAKFPFKTSLILTKPTEWLASGTDWTTKKATELTKGGYNWLNDSIKNASDNKIDNIFDIFTKTYSTGLGVIGEGTEWGGDKGFDLLKTSQKREILEEFYRTRTSQDVRNILEKIDIQSQLQDSSPHLFDNVEEDIDIDFSKHEAELKEIENINIAETAVKAYEDASINDLTEIASAKILEPAATASKDTLTTGTKKTAFETRISAKNTAIAAKEAELKEIENINIAETAVKAYEDASINDLTEIASAKILEPAAIAAKGVLTSGTKKTEFNTRITNKTNAINSKEAEFQKNDRIAFAESEVSAYESADISDLAKIIVAETLKLPAETAVGLIGDTSKETTYNTRIANMKKKINETRLRIINLDPSTFSSLNILGIDKLGDKITAPVIGNKLILGTSSPGNHAIVYIKNNTPNLIVDFLVSKNGTQYIFQNQKMEIVDSGVQFPDRKLSGEDFSDYINIKEYRLY